MCRSYYASTAPRPHKDCVPELRMHFSLPRVLVSLITIVVALAALVVLAFAGAYQYLAPEIPSAGELREVRSQLPLQVLSRDGKLIAQFGEQRRIPVTREEIPQVVVDAFLAAEDDRFFEHPGVDWQGLVRAVISNLSAGGVREGGGTITMQLARNTVLTSERTLRRKLKEIILARRLEREFTKNEILTLYLNRIFLGQRSYGVGAAAEVYFTKRIGDVTLAEAALIAGLPRSPSRDNPVASLARASDRRAYVLRRMLETGKIDPSAHDAAAQVPILARLYGPAIELDAPYVAEMARADMVRRYGQAALIDGYRVYTTIDSRLQGAADEATRRTLLEYDRRHGYRGPLEALDAAAMGDEIAIAAAFARHRRRGPLVPALVVEVGETTARVRFRDQSIVGLAWDGLKWARPALPDDRLGPNPKVASDVLAPGQLVYVVAEEDGGYQLGQLPAVAGALVALDPNDGSIIALAGGFDFFDSKYNRAMQAQRQPGSAFKPFLYSAALERGFTPATLVNDAPIVIEGGDTQEEWRPQNITRRFYGPTPMREGLVRSRNLVSIRLLRGIGIGYATKHIAAFGFSPAALPANLTLALGTGQVTPVEMARGFAVFANGGFRVEPNFVSRVQTIDGRDLPIEAPLRACPACAFSDDEADQKSIEQSSDGIVPPAERAPRAISAANAFVMTDIMTDVIQRGTAQAARALNRRDLAGKTGTTSERRDAWFAGFNADIVATAWIGFDQERTLGDSEEGGRTALPMWIYFMQEALEDRPEHRQPEPPGVVRMWVSRTSGTAARAGAPDALFETFLEQHVPQGNESPSDDSVDSESVQPEQQDEGLF
jgi:penicillin-binding protein 1A